MKNPRFPIFIIYLLFFLFLFSPLYSQTKAPDTSIEVNAYAGTGGQNPFWFVSNQHGKYSLSKNGIITALKLASQSDTSAVFDINYGLEIVNRYDGTDNLWFNQAFLQVDYKNSIRLSAGYMEETFGNEFIPLSTGSIIWSGNARPMPKIMLGTAGYVDLPFTNGLVKIKGALAHGWFEHNRYVEGVQLHQKYIGVRSGWNFPLNVEYVFYHFAQWGGDHPIFGRLPDSIDDYFRVFFAQKADEGAPTSWQINKIGNHVGSSNIGVDWTSDNYKIGLYHQDIFEDGSGLRKENFPDGLWGVFLRLNDQGSIVTGVLYEYLQTTDQSGPIHSLEEGLRGADNYFNHGTYQSGWTNYYMTIGTPFITSPIYTLDVDHSRNFRIWNNRVKAHHFGIKGRALEGLNYRALISYSINKGIYPDLYLPDEFRFTSPRYQWSWRLDLNYDLPAIENIKIGFSMAADTGEMYGDNLGFMLRVAYGM